MCTGETLCTLLLMYRAAHTCIGGDKTRSTFGLELAVQGIDPLQRVSGPWGPTPSLGGWPGPLYHLGSDPGLLWRLFGMLAPRSQAFIRGTLVLWIRGNTAKAYGPYIKPWGGPLARTCTPFV